MSSIVKGTTVTYDYNLAGPDGEPFDLASCTVNFVATGPDGSTVISHYLTVDAFGDEDTSSGLTLETSVTGKITQVLSSVVTAALPDGRLTWRVTLTDSTGAVSYPLSGSWVVVTAARAPVTTVANGPTRAQLRRRIAQNIGDYKTLEVTSVNGGNDIIDSLNVSSASEDLSGCQIIVTSGVNTGHIARIQSVNASLHKAVLNPQPSQSFAVGDTADVVMKRGRGWEVREYHQAINDAINDAYPFNMAELLAPAADFDVDTGIIYVPQEFIEVYAVEWQDSNGNWHPVPKAQRTGGWGWKVDAANGTVTITDSPRYLADNQPMRIYGYGKHPELKSETDRTDISPEWLTARASYYLCRGGMDRDPQRSSLILLFEREAAALRPRLRMLRKGATARVRAS
jgi:hypothetical protein